MGQLRFLLAGGELSGAPAAALGYLAGLEGIPWRGGCHWLPAATADGPGELVLERDCNESGCLHVPWCVDGYGEVVLSTACLMERTRPYHLPVELARGTLNRLRNQLADWQAAGLQIPAELEAATRTVSRNFGAAVTGGQVADQAARAQRVISESLQIARRVSAEYSAQWLAARQAQTGSLPSLLGGVLPQRPLSAAEADWVRRSWNAATVSMRWSAIEPAPDQFQWDAVDQQVHWCLSQGLRVIGGPLLALAPGNVPDWIAARPLDYELLQRRLIRFIRVAVARFRGQVHVWKCTGGINVPGDPALAEEQRLRLAVAVIDEVRRLDPHTPAVAVFDQPWAEYMAASDLDLSPLHFADSLLRADLGLTGMGLELNIGYWPGWTLPRDVLELSRQLDRWSLLGMPLLIFLAVPSAAAPQSDARPVARQPCGRSGQLSLERQHEEASRMMPLILAKPYVQGLFWNQLADDANLPLAPTGLFDASGHSKPICHWWTSFYRQHFT